MPCCSRHPRVAADPKLDFVYRNLEVPTSRVLQRMERHGVLVDAVALAAQSEELVEALRRLHKTFEYVTYPGEGHGFLSFGPQVDYYRRVERFLDWVLM